MALLIAGIDEAGYGPLLGPLCVAMTCFRVRSWEPGDAAPDLWGMLAPTVGRAGRGASSTLLVDDSKRVKLANSTPVAGGRHPLMHLERGVLSFLACSETGSSSDLIESDGSLMRTLNARCPTEPWYGEPTIPLPLSWTPQQGKIATNLLRRSLAVAEVDVISLRAEVLSEAEFNRLVAERGTKAATTEACLTAHLRHAWENWAEHGANDGGGGPRIVCDAHGGRIQYAAMLSRAVPGEYGVSEVVIQEESPRRSRYLLLGKGVSGAPREMTVHFMPEADGTHLPVALASMTAKLCRELLMARFNRYWHARMPDLKPTAGYTQDARRWLQDAHEVIRGGERAAMVRRA